MQNMRELLTETKHLTRQVSQEYPEFIQALGGFNRAAMKDGALPAKMKELMALAISVYSQCSYCIAFHVKGALDAGASKDEIMETVFVAVLLGGGPAFMYAKEARKALDDLAG